MPTRPLPSDPDLEHLRGQARDLQRAARAGDPGALAAVEEHHPRFGARDASDLRLTDAQLVVARSYGFASWPRLVHHLDVVAERRSNPHHAPTGDDVDPVSRFLALACLTYGNADHPDRRREARAMLDADPGLATRDVWTMAAAGEADALREALTGRPPLVDAPGGPHGWAPLLYACYSRLEPLDPGRSTLAAARVLLDAGADPNAGFLWEGLPSPFTALTGALGGGEDAANQPPHPQWRELARSLLERGADPDDAQALYNRMFDPSDDHLQLLAEHGLGRSDGGPWRRRMPDATQPVAAMLAMQLQWAAGHGMPERVRLLLDLGVDPDGRSGHPTFGGRTAAVLAAQRGDDPIVELLVSRGAAVPALDPEEQLVAACLRGDRAVAERLVATDPGLVRRTEQHHAPMVLAAERRHVGALRLLVDLGFDVDAGGRTSALHEAASTGSVEVVKALLDLGADPNRRDRAFDAPALGWARHNGHDEVAALLEPLTDAG